MELVVILNMTVWHLGVAAVLLHITILLKAVQCLCLKLRAVPSKSNWGELFRYYGFCHLKPQSGLAYVTVAVSV
jgi:hypothetical protein